MEITLNVSVLVLTMLYSDFGIVIYPIDNDLTFLMGVFEKSNFMLAGSGYKYRFRANDGMLSIISFIHE